MYEVICVFAEGHSVYCVLNHCQAAAVLRCCRFKKYLSNLAFLIDQVNPADPPAM
jgi:hypothetical protein